MGSSVRPSALESIPPAAEGGRSGIDGLVDDLERTEEGHFRGRCLPYVRASVLLRSIVAGAQRSEEIVHRLAQVWGTRWSHVYYERPFLLLAALRAEALASPHHPLARGFATENPDPLAVTRAALVESLQPARASFWCSLASRLPQTNEVSRAVVWTWPAELAGCAARGRPLGLVDVGASGGLSLIADRLGGSWEEASGAPLRVVTDPNVCLRVGFDLHPLDFKVDADVQWARACIWPGAVERVARFDRAILAWRAEGERSGALPAVHAMNAPLVPARLPAFLDRVPDAGVLFVYQTVLRDYVAPSKRARYEEGMRRWLAGVPRGRAAWLEAETDAQPGSLAITAHVPDGAGGVRSLALAVTSVHPKLVDVHAQAAAEFSAYFRAPRR